ncbi:hypothetical protein [Ruminococcus sp. AM31-15AC]|uniref:hypothetical protein n=1 Tax=Ruminococcus sp. AM31-15AC TaxID=2293202 RepID=UPI0011C1A677
MNKLLALLQILIKQTDENHKLTTNQLIEKLAEQGVAAHRNTIPADIERLRNAGYDVICDKSTQNKYFIGSRGLESAEIKNALRRRKRSTVYFGRKISRAYRQAVFTVKCLSKE